MVTIHCMMATQDVHDGCHSAVPGPRIGHFDVLVVASEIPEGREAPRGHSQAQRSGQLSPKRNDSRQAGQHTCGAVQCAKCYSIAVETITSRLFTQRIAPTSPPATGSLRMREPRTTARNPAPRIAYVQLCLEHSPVRRMYNSASSILSRPQDSMEKPIHKVLRE